MTAPPSLRHPGPSAADAVARALDRRYNNNMPARFKRKHRPLPDRIGLGLLPPSQRAAVDAYVLEVEQVAAELRSFAYRVAQGPGLAGGDGIAAAAESQKWTQRNIRVSVAGVRGGCASTVATQGNTPVSVAGVGGGGCGIKV